MNKDFPAAFPNFTDGKTKVKGGSGTGQPHTAESEVKLEATTISAPLLVQEGLRIWDT